MSPPCWSECAERSDVSRSVMGAEERQKRQVPLGYLTTGFDTTQVHDASDNVSLNVWGIISDQNRMMDALFGLCACRPGQEMVEQQE
jgi:hypothetical protein